MDDNDEEGDYNGDFYAKLPEGAEEPRLPTFQNFSFEANPAAEAGSSIAQQSTQADGGQQDPQPEPDDVNDDSVPVQGGDEDEYGGEEPVTYEAQDRAVGQFMQQVIQNVQQRHPAGHGQQHTAPVHLQQPSAQTQQLASTLPPGRQRLRVERTNAEFDTQDQRIDYWLRRGSSHLLGDRPREAEQQAMTADGWRARYGNMSAAERLAHDIPTPPGQPPVQQRTKRKWWSPEVGTGKKKPKRKAQPKTRGRTKRRGTARPQGGGGDDDDDYESLDENDENFTTYIPEQAYVAEDNLPYLMGIREIDPTLPAANDPQDPGMLTENGRAVLGPRGARLRNLPILPRRIGDKCPGWLIEAWMRYDKRVSIQDIADRLPQAKKQPIKSAIDYRERKGLFMKSQKQRKNVKEENAARDFIIATKTDCEAADILDPPAPRSETDDQRRERVESLRQKIFRNTVWEFHRDRNGVIRGIKQPGGVSGAHFPLPPLAGLDATRLRAASAKRNQLRTYSIAEGNSTKWEAFAARYPEICWGHRRTGKGPAEDDTNNASETSISAADPSTQGDHNTAFIPTSGLNIAAEENSNPSTAEEAMAALSRARNRQAARSRANADPSTVLSTHTRERSNQAETVDDQTEDDFDPGTEAPESTTEDQQKQPPKDARICFDFVENEVLHRLELQALANLRFRAVLGIPEWVQRQLNQLSQEQQGTDAGEQEQEDTFGPRQTVDIVREAVRAGWEAIRLNVFRNQNWRYNHNNLQSDRESNNRVLVFRSAITLLTILRHQTKDNIMSALDENDEDLLAIYAGENEEAMKVRDEFARLVTRHVNKHWRGYFPEDFGFGPEYIESPSSTAGGATRSPATGSQGQQKSPSPTRPQNARNRPEMGSPSQPDDNDDDDDDDDDGDGRGDGNGEVGEKAMVPMEKLLRQQLAEQKQKQQQQTQNAARQNPAPTPNTTTNNQQGPNQQQHGQGDTDKPSTEATPRRRSSRSASAAAKAAIQQQTTPTRTTRSSQHKRVPSDRIDPSLYDPGLGGPQASPGGGGGGGAEGPMSPPPRPAAINTSPRTPNGRRQAPVNALSPRRSPRLLRSSQGSAQQQQPQLPVETGPTANTGDWEDDNVYPGDDMLHGPAGSSPNTAGELMDQLTQENGRYNYPSPKSVGRSRTQAGMYGNGPYYGPPQQYGLQGQQHHAPYGTYDLNNDPFLQNQGQTWHNQQPHQPQMPGPRNSFDEIGQRIVTEVGGWNMTQRQQELEQMLQQQQHQRQPLPQSQQIGIIGQYSDRIRQLDQAQGRVRPQRPPATHPHPPHPPVLPSAQQPTAQAPITDPQLEATAAATAQAPPSTQPPPQAPESEPQPQPKKPAAKKTAGGGGARGKKRKASEDPIDNASTTQPKTKTKVTTKKTATAATRTTKATTKATTKTRATTAPPPPDPSTRRMTRAQTAEAAEAAKAEESGQPSGQPSGQAAGGQGGSAAATATATATTTEQSSSQTSQVVGGSAAAHASAPAEDDGGADGEGGAGDDGKADAKATTERAPVKRKRGEGEGAAKAPSSRLQKTRKAVKEGRVSNVHEVVGDPPKGTRGKGSTQPGKKRKLMDAEKEEDDDMRDRDDDDDGDSDYKED